MPIPGAQLLRRISFVWLLAIAMTVAAGVPLLILGELEVGSLERLQDEIVGRCRETGDTVAKRSAYYLHIRYVETIHQALSDKAASVDKFFEDVRNLVVWMRGSTLRAWQGKGSTGADPLILAEDMRTPARRPQDSFEDPRRGCMVSFSAPMIHAPAAASAAARDAARRRFRGAAFDLQRILETDRSLILFTYVAASDGMFMSYPADASLKPDYEPRAREWYRRAAKGEEHVWIRPYRDAGTGVMVMTCAAPARLDGECVAVVGLDVVLDPFMEEVLSLPAYPHADAALVDGQGQFIVSRMATHQGEAPKTPADVYLRENVERILTGQTDMFHFEYQGVKRLAGVRRIPSVGWHMVVTMPEHITMELSRNIKARVNGTADIIEESMHGGVRAAIYRLGALAMAVTAAVLGLSIVVGLVFSRPILVLMRMAHRVARGDFRARAPALPTREFDELAGSFNIMAKELAEYTERTARQAAERERIATELSTAREIQTSLLTKAFPAMADAQVHAIWMPARETAGDFYDVIELPDGRVGLLMADVSGKGLGAAVFMAMSSSLLRTTARTVDTPDELLRRVNAALLVENEACVFVTAVYAIYDPRTGRLQIADAGHTYPLLRLAGECQLLKIEGGPPLGVFDEDLYRTTELQLQPGDSIAFYTDGVTEALSTDDELFGDERVLEVYAQEPDEPADQICERLLGAAQQWSAGRRQSDDIAILALSIMKETLS